ncbi:MAG: hypothetical protein R6V58_03420, partial [Planctomycetota bacterium]
GLYGRNFSTSGTAVFGYASAATGTTYGMRGEVASPDGWAGHFTGGQGIYTEGLKIPTGAADGYVLQCDADGVASWMDVGAAVWQLDGNAGTTPGTDFLGTTDNTALQFHVNSNRAFRIEPQVTSPNILGGYSGNAATAGVNGGTIAGGGYFSKVNKVTDHYCTVGGGTNNVAGDDAGSLDDADYATVGGGRDNTASSTSATVAGGRQNTASGETSTIGGGSINTASGEDSTVAGGGDNTASNTDATVGGGCDNTAGGAGSTVAGGDSNTANGNYASVAGGNANNAGGNCTIIPGGQNCSASADYGFAAGRRAKSNHDGAFVWADSTNADFNSSTGNEFAARATGGVRLLTSSAGDGLRIEPHATSPNLIGGHALNSVPAGAYGCTIAGGGTAANPNKATDPYCTVGGGIGNLAGNDDGNFEIDDADSATVCGGWGNSATNVLATVCGGEDNTASGDSSFIGGGENNVASGDSATVSGGMENTASGELSVIPGGELNSAAGNYSFAAGRRAKVGATHQGAFTWADSTNADFNSTAADRFEARADGGVRFYTDSSDLGIYAELVHGSGSWASPCDRDKKENFTAVDTKEILRKLVAVPITNWNYRTQDDAVRHMSPVAQDLYAAFGLGTSNTSITTIDGIGISMAAIQGLHQVCQEKDEKIADQAAQIADQAARIDELEARLDRLEGLVESLTSGDPNN